MRTLATAVTGAERPEIMSRSQASSTRWMRARAPWSATAANAAAVSASTTRVTTVSRRRAASSLLLGYPGHARTPSAQRQVFLGPDVRDRDGPGHEGDPAVDRGREDLGRTGREIEPVGGTAAGEGVDAQPGEPGTPGRREVEPLGARLVRGLRLVAGNVAGRGQGDGHSPGSGLVRVQPEHGAAAGHVAPPT